LLFFLNWRNIFTPKRKISTCPKRCLKQARCRPSAGIICGRPLSYTCPLHCKTTPITVTLKIGKFAILPQGKLVHILDLYAFCLRVKELVREYQTDREIKRHTDGQTDGPVRTAAWLWRRAYSRANRPQIAVNGA